MRAAFDPARILAVLARHEVDFIVIGGLAGALHGSPAHTNDADIVPRRTPENLDRLAGALRELDARIRTEAVPEGLPFDRSGAFLNTVELVNLQTDAGDLDVSHRPAGSNGYEDLIVHAVPMSAFDVDFKVASLDDIIHSKRTANRPKDHATLPILEALRDEIDAAASAGW